MIKSFISITEYWYIYFFGPAHVLNQLDFWYVVVFTWSRKSTTNVSLTLKSMWDHSLDYEDHF